MAPAVENRMPLEQEKSWNHQISWLCSFLCLNGPSKVIFGICFWNFWKTEKSFFDSFNIKGSPLWKKFKNIKRILFLCKRSYFSFLILYCTCYLLPFEVYNSHVSKIFKFWPIFAWKFSFYAIVLLQLLWQKIKK